MSNKSDQTKLERYLELSEHGVSSFQCFLASEIISSTSYPNRIVEALKWVLISRFLEDELATDSVIDFLSRGMDEDEINFAFELAEHWIQAKINIAKNDEIDLSKPDWSKQLQKLSGLEERLKRHI